MLLVDYFLLSIVEAQKCESISTLSEGQRTLAYSKLLTTSVAIHPHQGYGSLVILLLRWPIQVDPLPPDR